MKPQQARVIPGDVFVGTTAFRADVHDCAAQRPHNAHMCSWSHLAAHTVPTQPATAPAHREACVRRGEMHTT
eukprot:365187-Chlamydomonas_euryale.AAC.24